MRSVFGLYGPDWGTIVEPRYFTKARNMFWSSIKGQIPSNTRALCLVPGIGPYTAGAIASICFDQRVPAVDGNVVRVLSQLCGARGIDPKDPKTIQSVRQWAEMLYEHGDPGVEGKSELPTKGEGASAPFRWGDVTEGLIELGALICKPNGAPDCHRCPLAAYCSARKLVACGDIEDIDGTIPCRGGKAKVQQQTCVSIVHVAPSTGGTGDRHALDLATAAAAGHGVVREPLRVPVNYAGYRGG